MKIKALYVRIFRKFIILVFFPHCSRKNHYMSCTNFVKFFQLNFFCFMMINKSNLFHYTTALHVPLIMTAPNSFQTKDVVLTEMFKRSFTTPYLRYSSRTSFISTGLSVIMQSTPISISIRISSASFIVQY